MNKEFTNEDIINAAKHCATNADCDNCPFFATLEIEGCIETFTRYIVNNTKNEPAPAATGTSSEVVSKDTDNIQIDDSTKSDICQVLASAMSTLLALRQEMEPHEKKAFELGETYKDICCASAWMSNVQKGCDGNEH
ncbi:MAG: hypothetical protein KH702_05325 [Ruminococcus bicirculans]|nr:hypothetical protein [Ruminococcus bicirculans (ex Wegman et al. 2014)]